MLLFSICVNMWYSFSCCYYWTLSSNVPFQSTMLEDVWSSPRKTGFTCSKKFPLLSLEVCFVQVRVWTFLNLFGAMYGILMKAAIFVGYLITLFVSHETCFFLLQMLNLRFQNATSRLCWRRLYVLKFCWNISGSLFGKNAEKWQTY